MKKNYIKIGVGVVLVAIAAFYWYELRPTQIRKNCQEKSTSSIRDMFKNVPNKLEAVRFERDTMKTDYESMYKQCLRESGLEK